MNVLEKIVSSVNNFSKSERKVADVILANPQVTIHSSIAALAKMADVSEPTVNRFCRRLDTKGFPDFKLHLAQSLANGTPYVNRHVEEEDGPEAYTAKIFESTMAALDTARQRVDISTINKAVDVLTQIQGGAVLPAMLTVGGGYGAGCSGGRRGCRRAEDAKKTPPRGGVLHGVAGGCGQLSSFIAR